MSKWLASRRWKEMYKEVIERQLEGYRKEQAMRTLGFAYQILDDNTNAFKEGFRCC